MHTDGSRQPTRTGAVRRLLVAILVACACTLAFIPTATARRDHERRAATTTPAAAAPSAETGDEAASPSSTDVPPAAPAAPVQSPSDPHHAAGAGEAPTGKRAKHGGRSQHGAAATQPGASSTQAGEAEQQEASSSGEAGDAQDQPSTQSAAARSGRGKHKEAHKEGSGAHEGGKHEGEKKGKGKGKGKTSESESSSGSGSGESSTGGAPQGESRHDSPSATLAPQLPVSGPVALAASTATTVQTTPTAATGTSAIGTSLRARHAPQRRPRSSARARSRAALALTASQPTQIALAPTRAPARARHARGSSAHKAAAGRSSPIVRTITRIVDVVPPAMRMLIGGLLALALALALRSSLAALRARRLDRQRAELLEDVGLLQAALLPTVPARLGPVGTSVAYRPAAGPGAGGDFYDVFALEDGQLAVIVGDVSGHGRHALPHTALVRFTLRAYLEAGLSPRDALQTAGAVLERQLGDAFATVVLATYEPRERVLVYACAGHPPPIVLGAQPGARPVPALTICTAPPIGVGMRTGTRQTAISIPGRARVCFHTDGVTEARVGSELFGSARLADTLAELEPQESADSLLERVARRADARPDDMAACVLSIEGEDDAPTLLVEELELDREDAASIRTERFLRACGVQRADVADVVHSARVAAGRARTVVLQVRRGEGQAEVALHREHLAYLHAPRESVEVAR
jgi:serine phosphatase RsbU (regulator of sigma subunit)